MARKLSDAGPLEKFIALFDLLLTEISKHLDDDDLNFCEKLLPWSKDLPEKCRKKQ